MINIYKNHSPIFLHNLFFLLESFKSLCKVVEINVVVIPSVLKESWITTCSDMECSGRLPEECCHLAECHLVLVGGQGGRADPLPCPHWPEPEEEESPGTNPFSGPPEGSTEGALRTGRDLLCCGQGTAAVEAGRRCYRRREEEPRCWEGGPHLRYSDTGRAAATEEQRNLRGKIISMQDFSILCW